MAFSINHFLKKYKSVAFIILLQLFSNCILSQTTCSLGNPVFIENFGSGTARLGPSLNQDPNANVHPSFRPADLYTYIGTGNIGQDQYGLIKNPKDAAANGNAGWNDSFQDHTPDNIDGGLGYMYYCDAKEDLNVFYAQKITGLCPEIEYELSTWFAKTNAPDYHIDPDIKLIVGFTDINDSAIGNIYETNTGSIEGVGSNRWHRESLVFTVPAGTENIYFMLKNNVSGTAGNDLAIDDIEVRPCGPQIDISNPTNIIDSNTILCITDSNDRDINLSANIPNNFVMQWQESYDSITWSDIPNETSSTLNYTIPLTLNAIHSIRLKFAHNLNNLSNSNCYFFSEEIKYGQTYDYPVSNLELCDNLDDGDENNGIVQSFDLESQTGTILGGQLAIYNSVTYHISIADAISGNNPLSSPHENSASPQSQKIYVRILNSITNCVNTNLSFDLIVNSLPIANPINNLELCDNLDDGNNTNGVVQSFDLESQTNTILGVQPAVNNTVTYHLSIADAISGNNPLSSPHENSASPQSQKIYVRILNTNTNCVNTNLSFDLIVNPLPITNPVSNLELCDNLDDGNSANGVVQSFDLESQTNTILGGQPAINNVVTYHLSIADAVSGNNPLSSPHDNSASPQSQKIYVRILNTNTNCANTELTFDLIVHPLPTINTPVTLVQCDDDIDGISFFNLNEANTKISNNTINETFTYYTSQLAALAGDASSPDFITDPTTYANSASPFNDTVWSRITSQFGCAVVSEVQLSVSITAIPNTFQHSFIICDDFLDINGNNNVDNNDRDGITAFDFSSIRTLVEAMFLPQTPTINFYRNEADALAEINEISDISNYRNIGYPGMQQIYIRVDSALGNDCLGLGAHITLNVESLPMANTVTINRACDYDTSDTLQTFPFDTSQIETTVLGAQSPADVTVSYFDDTNNLLPSPLPNPFLTGSQTITIRVTNNVTTDPNGPCYDETTLEFVVDEQPIITGTIPSQVVCDGDAGDNDNDNIYPFDTSTFANTILGLQSGMGIYFDYIDENGILILDSPSLPNPLISASQVITVDIINPNNTNCSATTSIDLIVNPLPEFSFDPVPPVCTSDPTFTIKLDPNEANLTESFTYIWHWTSIDNTIVNQLLPDTTPTLTVSTPGTYSVTLTKTDGTGCSRMREVFVNASEQAIITLDDITIVDFSNNNTITINTTNLGQGDYEFALEGEINYSYRDEPYFENVVPGIYTLLVNDKNGCGTTTLKISVIGYPKFFTPNGDGYHDTWQIKGISSLFQPNSTIYIFDRYGKLLKQLNPLGEGWNGNFNGNQLPSNDYWFSVLLQDGRLFKGHFTLKR